jgi:pyruvate-formate lyase
MILSQNMTKRNKKMYDNLIKRSMTDRSEEWFDENRLPNIADLYRNDSVLIRKARAIEAMLKAMVDNEKFPNTETGIIFEHELLLGTLPMGSNGLGKVFPNYLTPDEKRAGSTTNRSSMSLLGHNTINYTDLVNNGLEDIIKKCDEKQDKPEINHIFYNDLLKNDKHVRSEQKDFYESVKISCNAVIEYAEKFAEKAEAESRKVKNSKRINELKELARIARKVPRYKADTFHEAVQSIWFFHLALHASTNLVSLGRLDQVLYPFLKKEKNKNKCLEIFEGFLIKAAWRLNLNLSFDNIIKQDHVDNSTVLGVNPYLIDQKAGINNFLQNIIVGGITPGGKDATNACTYLIIQAFSNVNLSTPGIYVRVGKNTPNQLFEYIAKAWKKTNNNPAILNDDILIPALYSALTQDEKIPDEDRQKMFQELANDYCVDGCWEPILNGKSDWTFGMLSALNPVECALNEGALLSNNPELLRGQKIAPRTKEPRNYKELMVAFSTHMNFFIDQNIMSLFKYYLLDEYACPSPLLSAYMSGCMDSGRDKSWGGSNHNIGGVIISGIPNAVDTLAAIKKWVFDEKKYTLTEVREALRSDFKSPDSLAAQMKVDFRTNTSSFGNNDKYINDVAKDVLDIYINSVKSAGEFSKKIYQNKPKKEKLEEIIALRNISGYYGVSLEEKFGRFDMKITAGMGTFEQYSWMGNGNSASARRLRGEPLAPNFSPVSGSVTNGIGGILGSIEGIDLNRFAAGVITDICIDSSCSDEKYLIGLAKSIVENKGSMFTVTIGNKELYKEIYEQVIASENIGSGLASIELLEKYANVNVRIGGWQTPFITLPLSHMENYMNRPLK